MFTTLRSRSLGALVLSSAVTLAVLPAIANAQTRAASKPAAKAAAATAEKMPMLELRSADNPVVLLKTSKGDVYVELFQKEAPISTANFLKYVDDGFYDGTIFHRVIDGFMIQGGGFTPDMEQKKPGDPIKNEATNGEKNLRGTLAMARTNVVDSATSQFFVSVVDNAFLDNKNTTPAGYGYAVFGRVVHGMDAVDAIKSVSTASKGGHQNVPVEPVSIVSAKRHQAAK